MLITYSVFAYNNRQWYGLYGIVLKIYTKIIGGSMIEMVTKSSNIDFVVSVNATKLENKYLNLNEL